MAFIDDAVHTGKPLYDSHAFVMRTPRQLLLLAAMTASVAIWAIIILVVMSRF